MSDVFRITSHHIEEFFIFLQDEYIDLALKKKLKFWHHDLIIPPEDGPRIIFVDKFGNKRIRATLMEIFVKWPVLTRRNIRLTAYRSSPRLLSLLCTWLCCNKDWDMERARREQELFISHDDFICFSGAVVRQFS